MSASATHARIFLTPITSGAKSEGRFGKQDFVYLPAEAVYLCPAGERLTYRYTNEEDGKALRRYWTTAGAAAAVTAGAGASAMSEAHCAAGRLHRRADGFTSKAIAPFRGCTLHRGAPSPYYRLALDCPGQVISIGSAGLDVILRFAQWW